MRFKLILPSLTDAEGMRNRGVKYFRFPPLGLAALAAYLGPDDEIDLQDEHVETLRIDDSPDVVVIQTYVSSANRAYRLADHYRARGAYVCMGGLHVTSLPREAAAHADSIFLGPGEDTWPRFLADFRAGRPRRVYRSTTRCLVGAPRPRRDLIKKDLYLVPNTLVVSRGCPHHCDFCYKDAFYRGGSSHYTMAVDQALGEIERLPGRHLCFLDDNLLGDPAFASALFDGMRGMGRVWLAAGTVEAILTRPELIRKAAAAGMRSLFVGFETLSQESLRSVGKMHNVHRDYNAAIRRLHDQGVMVNRYDTRHAVFQPARMSPQALEEGYNRAYAEFGTWASIWRAAATKSTLPDRVRHLMFSSGLRKWKGLWAWAIRCRGLKRLVPLMEAVLSAFGRYPATEPQPQRDPRPTPAPHLLGGIAGPARHG
ncbi:MAG: radical SAM protein [Planctomycetota bacterium]|nr:radical SAM protein [Planctomycetota bacterium]